jgi:hypothetical protein
MKPASHPWRVLGLVLLLALPRMRAGLPEVSGPAAAVAFELSYRVETCAPGQLQCYPDARGIPFSDTAHIIALSASLWTPSDLLADFQRRTRAETSRGRKRAILVLLKSERCATKEARFCSITTAALEKAATPLARDFEIYGVQLKPRDGEAHPGSKGIETGADAWKNEAAGVYGFVQGPGATLVFLDPRTGSRLARTDAFSLDLNEAAFLAHHGRVPKLEALMREVLERLPAEPGAPGR